jgi:hypothetical protein
MAYTVEDVETRALALLGGDAAGGDGLRALCAAAASELESRLRAGVSSAELGDTFVTAAGILALSLYVQAGGADDRASVKAGSVAVSRRSGGSVRTSAAALRREAETLLAGYLSDRGFDFRGVRG